MSGPNLRCGFCAVAHDLDQEINYAVIIPTLWVFKSLTVNTQDLLGLVDE